MIWAPVILMTFSNIILAILNRTPYDVAVAWMIGAMGEELCFRWFLLKRLLLPRMKPVPAIILVSVLFAGMHLFNLRAGQPLFATLFQVFEAFCFSIWAGAVVWWKKSILIPLLAHVLLNLTAVTEGTLMPVLVSGVVLADGMMLMKSIEVE